MSIFFLFLANERLNHAWNYGFFDIGLEDSIYPYAHSFLNNNVTGRGLLNITVDDLYKLQVEKVGHQEIILEALELLKNLVRLPIHDAPEEMEGTKQQIIRGLT